MKKMMMMFPMTNRDREIKQLEESKLQQAKSTMFDEDGYFKLKYPQDFNFLLGYTATGVPARPRYVEYVEIPKITTKKIRI